MYLSDELKKKYTKEQLSARDAQRMAEFIAFGPIVFEVSRIMLKWGIFDLLRDKPMTIQEVAYSTRHSEYAIKCLLEASLTIGTVIVDVETNKFEISKIDLKLSVDAYWPPRRIFSSV